MDISKIKLGNTIYDVKDSSARSKLSSGEIVHYLTNVSGTAGSTTSGSYNRTRWTGTTNGVTSLYSGLVVFIKIPIAGCKYGVTLNVNSLGEHPVVLNVNSTISTLYAVGVILPLVYDADLTANAYVNNVNTTFTGCWKMPHYDTDVIVRLYKQITNNATWNQDYPLVASRTLSSAIAETDSTYVSMYGLIGSNSITPTVNPITGAVKVKSLTIDGTLLESKTAAENGTNLSLVTTGEKYRWNGTYTLSEADGMFYGLIFTSIQSWATSESHYDLNNLTDLGTYAITKNANAAYFDNKPVASSTAFKIVVERPRGSSSYIRQTFTFSNETGYRYVRHSNDSGSTWGNWIKDLNIAEYVIPAGKAVRVSFSHYYECKITGIADNSTALHISLEGSEAQWKCLQKGDSISWTDVGTEAKSVEIKNGSSEIPFPIHVQIFNRATCTFTEIDNLTGTAVEDVVATTSDIPTTLPASDVSAWAKAANKPSYTLDEVTDGSTRKLSNYLPLSGGTITGGFGALTIKKNTNNNSAIKFVGSTDNSLGYLGVNASGPIYTFDGSTLNQIWHEGNLPNPLNAIEKSSVNSTSNKWSIFAKIPSSTTSRYNDCIALVQGLGYYYNGSMTGAWIVEMRTDNAAVPSMTATCLLPTISNVEIEFGYYIDNEEGFIYYGVRTSSRRGTLSVVPLLRSANYTLLNDEDLTTAPTGWTVATHRIAASSYGELTYNVNAVASASGTVKLNATIPMHVLTVTNNVSSVALAGTLAEGHSCHAIFTCGATSYTVAIAHDATNRVCPEALDLSFTIPANGYVEVDFIKANGKIYVRGV